MSSTLIVPIVMLALLIAASRVYQHWLSKPRPSDIPLVKAKLEEGEHRVVDIRYDGFIPSSGYRIGYRKYRAVVRSPLGAADEVREMGVWANLVGAPGLVDLNRPHP